RPSRSHGSPDTCWKQLDDSPSGPSQNQHCSTSQETLHPFPGPVGPRSQASPGSRTPSPHDGSGHATQVSPTGHAVESHGSPDSLQNFFGDGGSAVQTSDSQSVPTAQGLPASAPGPAHVELLTTVSGWVGFTPAG